MKKLFTLAFVACALMFAGCEKEPEPEPGNEDTISLVGTWVLHKDFDAEEVLTMNADSTFELAYSPFYKAAGSYSYANKILTLKTVQAWERDYIRDESHGGPVLDENGNYQYTDWNEITPNEGEISIEVKMIYEGDVLMHKRVDDFGETPEVIWAPFVNVNATHVSNINDIQGKWYWLFNASDASSGFPRVMVKINGTNGEVIITPWGERYTGTVRYEKGVIYMDNPTFYTSRYDDEDGEWEHMNYEDPESTPWIIPSPDNPYASHGIFEGYLEVGFVVYENVGYGGIANLLAAFHKQ